MTTTETNSEESKLPSIMVVDDDIDTQELARYAAKNVGLYVRIKQGGLSALSFLRDLNYKVDAILIDLSMPDMDGITLTRQIRHNENLRSKQTPMRVYWFTSWPYDPSNCDDPIVLGAKELGVYEVFKKGEVDMMTIVQQVKDDLTKD